jgi:soluble lytic murein transglycosylase-like protein
MKEKIFLLVFGMFISLATLYIHEEREKVQPIIAETQEKQVLGTEVEITTQKETEIAIETTEIAVDEVKFVPITEIKLDTEMQEWIWNYCNDKNISPALVMAIIERESSCNSNCVGDRGNSFGYMQIYKKWHTDRMEKLGVTNLLDGKQNIMVGVDYLLELFQENPEATWVLNAYNGGRAYANRKSDTDYSIDVLDRSAVLERLYEKENK